MIGSGMPRRERAVLAVVLVVVLYAVAVLMWFMGREDAWAKSRKGYERAARQLAIENKLMVAACKCATKLEDCCETTK